MSAQSSLADVLVAAGEATVRLACERAVDGASVSALVERAFGPGRYAKVSERLREGNRMNGELSFCAFSGERLVGTVRQWPILVGAASGVFLGPIAVDDAWRRHGVGGLLIERSISAASQAQEAFILLVGDLGLFGPHGFVRVPPGRVTMPGPVDPLRVLVCCLRDGVLDSVSGPARVPLPTS